VSDRPLRLLYLADIRFPLERANGIQSIETCHALARLGHRVTLLVRPDTQVPSRDPYEFYGLPRLATLTVELAPVAGPPAGRRAAYLSYAIGRSLGRERQDLVFTRDLGLASLLLRLPRALRPPVVYEAHGIAADVAEARPQLLSGAAPASAAKLRRLARRDARVWQGAEGYVTITAGLAAELSRRFGSRPRVAVIPDGVRAVETPAMPPAGAHPFTLGYAGHLYPWKGVELIIEAVAALPDTAALIVGGHDREPDLQRLRDFSLSLDCAFTSPLKLFEYMAAGRPIIASDLPSIREVLADGHNALLVAAGNPQAITAAVRQLAGDPALGARLAAQALEDVREYTWDKRAARLTAHFHEVLA
jgi:glycosyltransferase involved in cell wall biosynthesis